MTEIPYQLLLGDCLEQMATLPTGSVDCVVTDLPFGTTRNAWDSIIPLDQLWSSWKRVCKAAAPIVLFTQQPFTTTVAASNLKELKSEWIWRKPQGTGFLNANRYPLKNHENILVFCDRRPPYHPQMTKGHKPYITGKNKGSSNYGSFDYVETHNEGTRYPISVLWFPRDKERLHPTQKPLALTEYLIKTYTNPGDTVLDCCMGSGTTIIAALNSGRKSIGIERDPHYYAVARLRLQKTAFLTTAPLPVNR